MFNLLSLVWFIRTTKDILFWIYLWQLKEYRFDRLIDHFRTYRGKQLFFNKLIFLKIILILIFSFLIIKETSFIFNLFFVFFLIILYSFESIKFFKDYFSKNLRLPIITKKTVLLISTGLIFEIAVLFFIFQIAQVGFVQMPQLSSQLVQAALLFLIIDIFIPLIVCFIIFLFQPLAVLLKRQIIKKAKQKIASHPNLITIGITGSYGKSSTKEFLFEILKAKYKVLKTLANNNTEIGVAKTILNSLNLEDQIFIAEMGAYKKGETKAICDIVKPKIGILTGINEQHMALFGSWENNISANFELIEALPEDGTAILNWDSLKIFNFQFSPKENLRLPTGQAIFNLKVKDIKFYSVMEKADVWAEDIKTEKEFISFKVCAKDEDFVDFKLNLLGKQNISNILGAIIAAKELGMSLEEILNACKKIKLEQGGIKLLKSKQGINIIDSSYSANPDGVIADLDYLKIWKAKENNSPAISAAVIMPCLIELGKASKKVHYRIGKKIGEICDLAIITTKDYFTEIKKGFIETSYERKDILFLEEPKEILEKIKNFYKKDDIILLEGRVNKKIIDGLIAS